MAQTLVRSVNIGGNLKLTVADVTETEAGATDSIAVAGGRVYAVLLTSQDTTGAMAMSFPRHSVSLSGNVSTITIYTQEGITTGTLVVLHA